MVHKFVLPGSLVGIGLVIALASLVLGFFVVPNVIDNRIKETVRLKNGSDTWDDWSLNPVDVHLKFYIFHVNNPDSAIVKREKPDLTERGPYVFTETRRKIASKIDEKEDEITYRQTIHYVFNETLSVDEDGNKLSLSDVVNVVNLPFIAITTQLYSMRLSPLSTWALNMIFKEKETFVKQNVTVAQTLFEGWPYPQLYSLLMSLSGKSLPEFNDGRFGFYRGKNGSSDGEYVIRGGLNDIKDLGRVLKWNGQSELTFWKNPREVPKDTNLPSPQTCNAIRGSDGAIFPPFLTKEMKLPIFSMEVCRSIDMVYEKEDTHWGITGLKYVFTDSFYDHPKDNSDNYCYCPSPDHKNLEASCAKGIIRLFTCRGGPLVTSSPHFYNGDELYRDKIVGMEPDKDKHETFLLLQPKSGLPLKLRKRIQMSLEVQSFADKFHEYFNGIDYTIFPALWASEEVELTEALADEMKSKLLNPIRIVDIVKWVGIAVGGLIIIVGIIFFIRRRRSSS